MYKHRSIPTSSDTKTVLRLYASVQSMLPRVVPPDVKDLTLHGYAIPPGTIVGTQAWTVHRNATAFPNPYYFEPERWLDETPLQKVCRCYGHGVHVFRGVTGSQESFMPFGIGASNCIGRHLATMTLKVRCRTYSEAFH